MMISAMEAVRLAATGVVPLVLLGSAPNGGLTYCIRTGPFPLSRQREWDSRRHLVGMGYTEQIGRGCGQPRCGAPVVMCPTCGVSAINVADDASILVATASDCVRGLHPILHCWQDIGSRGVLLGTPVSRVSGQSVRWVQLAA